MSDAVDVVLLLRRESRALEDALGQELGADEGELGGPLEEHEAHVAFGQVVVLLVQLGPRVEQLLGLLRHAALGLKAKRQEV